MLRIGILIVSDRSASGVRPDRTGPELSDYIAELGWTVAAQAILPDERAALEAKLVEWADRERLDIILTAGGTGLAPRDVTPDATRAVIEREVPGLAEAMRSAGRAQTPHAMLSRALAGVRGTTLIINLPGSPKAARESLMAIGPALPHAVQLLSQDPRAEDSH